MNVDEVKEAKKVLQQKIALEMKVFEKQSGVLITGIELYRNEAYGNGPDKVRGVKLEVQI